MLRGELSERCLAVDLLDRVEVGIQHPHVALSAGGRGNHGVRPLRPPRLNLRLVRGRVIETVRGQRLLVERIAGENRNPATCVLERGLEHGRRAGLGLRAHVIAPGPPSLWRRLCRYWCCLGVGSRPHTVREAMSSTNWWCLASSRCLLRCRKSATSVHSSFPSVLRNSPVPWCLLSAAFTPSAYPSSLACSTFALIFSMSSLLRPPFSR